MVRKRILVLLVAVAMVLSQPLALFGVNEDVTPEEVSIVGEVFSSQELSEEIKLADFSGRLGEWNRVAHTAYPADPSPPLLLRTTTDGEMLYTIVEGANRDTQNVFYISIAGREGGFNFIGRPNVHYVVANGYLYRVLNAMDTVRREYAPQVQNIPINNVSADGATLGNPLLPYVMTDKPEWFGADDDPDRDAARLERVVMEYHRNWTGMRLRLNQIGNPDPADIRISWRGMGTAAGPAGQVVANLPTATDTMLSVGTTFDRNRPEGVYFPEEEFDIIFNPLRGGGSNLQSSEPGECLCPGDECRHAGIHTDVYGNPLVGEDGPIDGQFYGYAYITWRSLEPEYGVFDWDQVRMYTKGDYPVVGPNMDQWQCQRGNRVTRALEEFARQGIYVQLRFVMDYPFGSPFGYWFEEYHPLQGGGIRFDNDPQRHLGYRRSHTELAMINMHNEAVADVPTWLIERMRQEPNLPNAACQHNIPNVPHTEPSTVITGPNGEPFYYPMGLYHCTIPNPSLIAGAANANSPGLDLKTCANGCIPYRRPLGLRGSHEFPAGTGGNAVPTPVQTELGWNPDEFWCAAGVWYMTPPPQISGGAGFTPRYDHHLMLGYHQRAVNALAAEIAREGSVWNTVANVQLGSLGRWGEWHNWPAQDSGTFPNAQVAYGFVRHYIEAFADNDNIQIGMRYANWISSRYNFAAFNDQTGHGGNLVYVNKYAGQNLAVTNPADGSEGHGGGTGLGGNINANMANVPAFTGITVGAQYTMAARNPAHWMYGWIGGEYGDQSVPTNSTWQEVQFDVSRQGDLHRGGMHDYGVGTGATRVHIMNTIQSFRWSHISNLAPRGPNAGRTNATTGSMQRAHKNNDAAYDNMGYQFFVEEVEIVDGELKRGESVDVRMVVNNVGAAPFYRSWPFEVSFIDEDGNVASTQIIEDVDITTWMPRHRAINNARPAPGQVCVITGIAYRSFAELAVEGNVFIPAHDGRNEVVFTVDVPANLRYSLEYTMAIAILDPILLDMNPGINWHNEASREDRRLPLAPFKVEVYEPCRDDIIAVLADANLLNQSDFSPANWRLFLPARNHAINVYNDADATRAEIDHATNTLRNLVNRSIE